MNTVSSLQTKNGGISRPLPRLFVRATVLRLCRNGIGLAGSLSHYSFFLGLLLASVGWSLTPSYSQANLLAHVTQTVQPDTSQILTKAQIAYDIRIAHPDSSRQLAEEALDQAEALDFGKGKGRALLAVGAYYWRVGDLDKGQTLLTEALKYAEDSHDRAIIGRIYNNLGIISRRRGDDDQALAYYFQSYEIAEVLQDSLELRSINNNIGVVYMGQGNNDGALTQFQKALALAQAAHIPIDEGHYLLNIGEIHQAQGKYSLAINDYQQAIHIGETINSEYLLGRGRINEGMVRCILNESQAALELLQEGLVFAEKLQNRRLIAQSHTYLGRTYRQLSQFQSAIESGERALTVSQDSDIDQYNGALRELHLSYAAAGQHANAYRIHVEFKAVSDSLARMAQTRTLASFEAERALETERLQNAEETLKQEKRIKSMLFMSITGLVFFVVLIVFFYRAKQGDNRKLHILNQEIQLQNEEVESQNEEITQQRDQLQLAYNNVEQLSQIGAALTSVLTMEDLIKIFIKEVGQLVDASRVGIALFREQEQDLYFPFTLEDGEWFKDGSIPITETHRWAVRCFLEQEGLRTGDFIGEIQDNLEDHPLIMGRMHSRSIIYLPITHHHKRLGVLSVQSVDKHVYRDYHMSLLQNLAVYIAVALENIEAIQQLENLSVVAQETNNMVVMTEPEGNLLWANQAFMTRYEFDSLEDFWDRQGRNILHFASSTQADAAFEKLRITKKPQNFTLRDTLSQEGAMRWWQVVISPLINDQEEVERVVVVATDISELRKAQDQLKNLTDRLSTVNQIDRALLQSESLEQILETSTLSLTQALDATRVDIALFNDAEETFVLEGVLHQEGKESSLSGGKRLPLSDYRGLPFLKQNVPHQVDDLCQEESLSPTDKLLLEEGHQAYISYPLMAKKQLIGALTVCFNRAFPFTEEMMEIIEEVASGIGLSIAHFRLQEELQRNHKLLTEKNQDVEASMAYAEKIQKSVLQSPESLQILLPQHFLINKPKEVVSGDFYWVEEYQGKLYVAVADCTGHGGPGALMSVICSNALTEALHSGVKSTGDLLDKTRERVVARLSKSGQEFTDGMDISLCSFDLESPVVQWSGAYNPLLLINTRRQAPPVGAQAISDTPGVFEFKAERQSISFSDDMYPFQSHTLQVKEGDILYLFTDGFQDQFGGPLNKKYLPKRLKRKLWEIHYHTVEVQKEILEREFDTWRGAYGQIDDICMMGIRIG